MNQTLANVAVVAATIGTITFLLPQITKLIKTNDAEGVSTTWAALGVVSNAGWFFYLISQELWVSLLAPFVTFFSYVVTIWALARAGRDQTKSAVVGSAWAVALIIITLTSGWPTLGVVLGVSYGGMLAPSIWSAYKTANPSGVSAGTWWIGVAEAALWGYFGLFHRDAGIIVFSVVGLIGSALMLLRYYSTRQPAGATL